MSEFILLIGASLLLSASVFLLGTSRIKAAINLVAFQGIVIAFFPLLTMQSDSFGLIIFTVLVALVLRGFVFPYLLKKSIVTVQISHELKPSISYASSMMLGLACVGYSIWMVGKLPLVEAGSNSIVVICGLSVCLIGILLLTTRRLIITQIISYLVLENGVFLLGIGLNVKEEILVQGGIMLDIFAAIFIMAMMTFRIQEEFDHIDVDQLDTLRG